MNQALFTWSPIIHFNKLVLLINFQCKIVSPWWNRTSQLDCIKVDLNYLYSQKLWKLIFEIKAENVCISRQFSKAKYKVWAHLTWHKCGDSAPVVLTFICFINIKGNLSLPLGFPLTEDGHKIKGNSIAD